MRQGKGKNMTTEEKKYIKRSNVEQKAFDLFIRKWDADSDPTGLIKKCFQASEKFFEVMENYWTLKDSAK